MNTELLLKKETGFFLMQSWTLLLKKWEQHFGVTSRDYSFPCFTQVDFWLSAEHHLTEHITKLLATFHSDAKAGKRQ